MYNLAAITFSIYQLHIQKHTKINNKHDERIQPPKEN